MLIDKKIKSIILMIHNEMEDMVWISVGINLNMLQSHHVDRPFLHKLILNDKRYQLFIVNIEKIFVLYCNLN